MADSSNLPKYGEKPRSKPDIERDYLYQEPTKVLESMNDLGQSVHNSCGCHVSRSSNATT